MPIKHVAQEHTAADAYRIWNSGDSAQRREMTRAVGACVCDVLSRVFKTKENRSHIVYDNDHADEYHSPYWSRWRYTLGYWFAFTARTQEMTSGYAISFFDGTDMGVSSEDIRNIEYAIYKLSRRWFGGMIINFTYEAYTQLVGISWMSPMGDVKIQVPIYKDKRAYAQWTKIVLQSAKEGINKFYTKDIRALVAGFGPAQLGIDYYANSGNPAGMISYGIHAKDPIAIFLDKFYNYINTLIYGPEAMTDLTPLRAWGIMVIDFCHGGVHYSDDGGTSVPEKIPRLDELMTGFTDELIQGRYGFADSLDPADNSDYIFFEYYPPIHKTLVRTPVVGS